MFGLSFSDSILKFYLNDNITALTRRYYSDTDKEALIKNPALIRGIIHEKTCMIIHL